MGALGDGRTQVDDEEVVGVGEEAGAGERDADDVLAREQVVAVRRRGWRRELKAGEGGGGGGGGRARGLGAEGRGR